MNAGQLYFVTRLFYWQTTWVVILNVLTTPLELRSFTNISTWSVTIRIIVRNNWWVSSSAWKQHRAKFRFDGIRRHYMVHSYPANKPVCLAVVTWMPEVVAVPAGYGRRPTPTPVSRVPFLALETDSGTYCDEVLQLPVLRGTMLPVLCPARDGYYCLNNVQVKPERLTVTLVSLPACSPSIDCCTYSDRLSERLCIF